MLRTDTRPCRLRDRSAQGSVCAGVQGDPGGLSAGEVRLCSAGGAQIVLKNNGEIWLNGLTITPSGEIRGYQKEE